MPRTKLDPPKYPPLDWLKAAILERKRVSKMGWDELAEGAGITPECLRKLVSTKPTSAWNEYVRRAVCRKLGLSAKLVITDLHEVEY